jgi:hypothetical protein
VGKKTPQVVAEAIDAGDHDKASVFLYAEMHNQLVSGRDITMPVMTLLDELAGSVLACLPGAPTGNELALARLVARLVAHPYAESAALIGRVN